MLKVTYQFIKGKTPREMIDLLSKYDTLLRVWENINGDLCISATKPDTQDVWYTIGTVESIKRAYEELL